MEGLLDKQLALATLIDRFRENTLKVGRANFNAGFLRGRRELLERYWRDFQVNHELLQNSEHLVGNEYLTGDRYSSVELNFSIALGMLYDEEAQIPGPVRMQQLDVHPAGPSQRQVILPKIALPTFSGLQEEWETFRDLFRSLIHIDPSLTGDQKLHYLKSCISGPAVDTLAGLATTEANYAVAWDLLTARYNDRQLLLHQHLGALASITQLTCESSEGLLRLNDLITKKHEALRMLEQPVEHWDQWFIFFALKGMDPSTRREWEKELSKPTVSATYERLTTFLKASAKMLKTIELSDATEKQKAPANRIESSRNRIYKGSSRLTRSCGVLTTASAEVNCPVCDNHHSVVRCEKFHSLPIAKRLDIVRTARLCFNCLAVGHTASNCQSHYRCRECNRSHHTLLHGERVGKRKSSSNARPDSADKRPRVEPRPTETFPLFIRRRDGRLDRARALIDPGSEVNLATVKVAERAGCTLKEVHVPLAAVGGHVFDTATYSSSLTLLPHDRGTRLLDVNVLLLPNLALTTPRDTLKRDNWSHLNGIRLADPSFTTPGDIDIVLGSEVYARIIRDGIRVGSDRTPTAQNSTLGWLIFGSVQSNRREATVAVNVAQHDPIKEILQKFWLLEEVNEPRRFSAADVYCERKFREGCRRSVSGRYIVRLLLKETEIAPATGSLDIARRALSRVRTKMKLDPVYAEEYSKFMSEYEALGHMRPVPNDALPPDAPRVFYLPHHAIWQVSDIGRKFKVVFNASSSSGGGWSVNNCLHTGPTLQTDLISVLCRWRLFRVAAGADIEKMYRQILVDTKDIDMQRTLWLGPDGVEKHYQLLTLTYGVSCAPFLALRVIKQLAVDESERFPRASKILLSSTYVDDILYGTDDIQSARELRDELLGITEAGGFRLSKWISSHPLVLDSIPIDRRLRPDWKDFSGDQPVKTLGIAWDPSTDEIRYKLPHTLEMKRPTKRDALSVIARFFDPLGWVSPILVVAKILLQDMWRDRLEWDDALPPALNNRWQNFLLGLSSVPQIRIPRWIGATSSSHLELHGFADASKAAYAAVVYVRVVDGSSQCPTRILASKTRVAPVKVQTIPRLELCAASLLAELIHKLQDGLGERVKSMQAWSDSTVALAWIKADPSRWEVFVANRVARIQQLLPETSWRHVSSEYNPADLASRGVDAAELSRSTLWWEGPSWLAKPPSDWPEQPALPISGSCIVNKGFTGNKTKPISRADFIERFSCLERLLRTIARCLRFKLLTRSGWKDLVSRPIDVSELNRAFHACVRIVQGLCFTEEIEILRSGHGLGRRNRLSALTPFIDTEGLLRVGGRIEHAKLPYDQRHPVIIPKGCQLGRLIIDRAHKTALHGGHALTYSYAMRSAWIIGGRAQTKSYVKQCITCAKARARSTNQLMGNLPPVRVEPSRPFSRTGVDYAGPFHIKASAGRGVRSTKGYLAIFVCMCTKAVHIELVGDLTTKSFLGALHRFSSRKTAPREIWSDNATTFHGADAELRAMFREAKLDWDRVSSDLASSGITWRFIPPAAPHFGGLWEAAVKSAKGHLKRTIGQRLLTFEEMSTLVARIESCMNSRPLTALSGEIDDLRALTPWHLMTGFPPTSLPEPEIDPTANLDPISHWRLVNGLRNQFWMRWSREYLLLLQQRQKWRQRQPNFDVGDLVLVLDTSLLRQGRWPLGRITAVYPGADGLLRVARIKTSVEEYDRPITKLCKLPIELRAQQN